MRQDRRRFLAGAGAALGGALAGCTDLVFGDGVEFEATAAHVSEAALDDTGYEEHEIVEAPITREFEAGGQSREVRLTNWHSQYDRAIEVQGFGRFQGAVFGIFSTPKVEIDIADETLNPIDDMDPEEIIDQVQGRYEGIQNLEQAGEYGAQVVGEAVTVAEFEGEATVAETDKTVDMTFHVTEAVGSGEDFLLCIAAHPTMLPGEGENVETLLNGVEHEE